VPLFLLGAALGGWGTYRLLGPERPEVSVGIADRGLVVGGRF
jgi:hypothetical protein